MTEFPRRYSDEMLWRLDERVRLHIEWIEKDHQEVLKRLTQLEAFKNEIDKPVHAAGWIVIGLVASFVAAIGTYLWRLISRLQIGP